MRVKAGFASADAILWLLTGTKYVTGEVIGVDGGIRLSGGGKRTRG